MKPDEIEALSFKIIDEEAGEHRFSPQEWNIVRRMIHTSADFGYMDTIRFHPKAIEAGLNAIRSGKAIITDTEMARVGIRKKELEYFKSGVTCFIHAPSIAKNAKVSGITRPRLLWMPPFPLWKTVSMWWEMRRPLFSVSLNS